MEKSYTGQITLIETHSGGSTTTYSITSSQEQIYKFVNKNTNELSFSPPSLQIKQKIENSSGPTIEENIQIPESNIEERKKIIISILTKQEKPNDWKEVKYDIYKDAFYDSEGYLNINFNTLKIINDSLPIGSVDKINDFFEYDSIIKISRELPGKKYIWSFFPSTFGMNEDMAKLSLQANGIYASIKEKGLTFDANGLTITNSGFSIVKKDFENNIVKVLGTDLKGNLYVKGQIEATSGSFNGTVQATFGSLGQLEILNALKINGDNSNLLIGTNYYEETKDISDSNKQYYIYDQERNMFVPTVVPQPASETEDGTIYYIAKPVNGIRSSNYKENEKGFLLQTDGTIYASEIILGNSATIANKLSIGNNQKCLISNPDLNKGEYISVKDEKGKNLFSLTEEGNIYLGNLFFSGQTSTIQTQNYSNGLGWSISPEKAIFNNVSVKGTIQSSVFKYGEVSSVGGILLIRPSSIIKEVQIDSQTQQINIHLESIFGFQKGGYCVFSQEGNFKKYYFKIINIDNVNNIIEGSFDSENSLNDPQIMIGEPLTFLGKTEYQNSEGKIIDGSIGICINGTDDIDSFTPPRAITVFTLGKEIGQYNNRIILGQIPNDEEKYGKIAGTYGLAAENVYLKGSLVTQTEQGSPSYSGISTTYAKDNSAPTTDNELGRKLFPGAKYIQDGIEKWNLGEILLWAGAKDTSKEGIEDSKFRVDKFGNLYAGSGYFSGTIITNASITAARIKTATIEGTGDSLNEDGTLNYPALNIVNAANGIRFASSDDKENSIEYMSLTKDGLVLNVPLITSSLSLGSDLNINKLIMKEKETTLEGTEEVIAGISIKPNYLSLWNKDIEGNHKILIQNNNKGLSFYNSIEYGNDWASNFTDLKFTIGKEVIVGNDNTNTNLKVKGSFMLGERAEYKMSKEKDGYDIYIK